MMDIRKKLENDGFVVLEGFLSENEADILKQEGENLVKNMPNREQRTIFSAADSELHQSKDKYFLESADKISYFFEEGALDSNGELKVDPSIALNKIGHALHELNPIFRKVTLDERVKETCFQLNLQEPAIVQSMYIFKNPGIGAEVKAHQDASYLYTDPPNLVGFWIALEDATLENGCLWVAKGSHKSGVHRRYIRNSDKSANDLLIYTSSAPYYPKSNFTPVPVKKGSCIIIHGQVVHFSEPNKSTQSRHAYTFHVIEERNTKYSKDNWLQLPNDKKFLGLYRN